MLLKDLIQNPDFDCNCHYSIYDMSNLKGTTKSWHDIQPVYNSRYNTDKPPDSLLNMKIGYITLDMIKHTLVIEVE